MTRLLPMAGQRGFSLVEMVLALALLALASVVLAQVGVLPVRLYDVNARRTAAMAELEAALALIHQETVTALPGSLRWTAAGARQAVELLRVRSSGRYRLAAPGDPLEFAPAPLDDRFDVLGPAVEAAVGDQMAIGPFGAGADPYRPEYRRAYAGPAGTVTQVLFLPAGAPYPAPAPAHRFHLLSGAVSLMCDPAQGTLTLFEGYAPQAAQPVEPSAAPLAGARQGLLAEGLTRCQLRHLAAAPGRPGRLLVELSKQAGEDVIRLYREFTLP